MKPARLIFLTALITSGASLHAQEPILVFEDMTTFGTTTQPGIVVTIPEADFEQTRKNWIKEIEMGTTSKVVTTNDEMTLFGARIKKLSADPVNIYSKMLNQDSLVRLIASFELKKDYYVSKTNNESEVTAAKQFMEQFAKAQYLSLLKDGLKKEKNNLKSIKKELSSLQKDKSRQQKSTQNKKSSITTEKDNIFQQNNEITRLAAEITEQTSQMTLMEEGPTKVEKASYIKELEKQKKKLEKDIRSSEKTINKANNSISQGDKDIPKIESDMETVRAKIVQQEARVREFTQKLNAVKAY